MAQWMRILDTVGGLAQMTGKLLPRPAETGMAQSQSGDALAGSGAIEARLAGVVVAALKEAFDRDRTRMEMERSQIEAERKRADELLAAELRRQSSERSLGQLKLIAVMAAAGWALSALLAVWLPGMHGGLSRVLLAAGWLLAFAALGCAFAAGQRIFTADLASAATHSAPGGAAAAAAPWVLLASLAAIAAGILTAL
ncbi:MAG: hypothetical protein ABJC51_07995 [Acidobacteriota bacterium]